MPPVTRREFVAAASATTALAYGQIQNANQRLRIGVIGCGGQAGSHMRALVKMRESDNCEIVAVCDVFDKRAAKAAELTGGKIAKDYRVILHDPNLNQVLTTSSGRALPTPTRARETTSSGPGGSRPRLSLLSAPPAAPAGRNTGIIREASPPICSPPPPRAPQRPGISRPPKPP